MNRQTWAVLVAALFISGCVNPAVSTIRDTRVTPSYTTPKVQEKSELHRKEPDAYRSTDPGRTYSLTLKNAELKDVLMLLSKESGVPIVAERGISGLVKIEAQNRKLGELLYAVLKPLGYTATVEKGIILVGRPQLTTRIFRVNYIKDKRNSSSNTNVSGFAASGSSGSVTVTTEGKSDFWGTLEGSLELLVFGTSGMGKRDGGGYIRGEAERKIVGERTVSGTAQTVGNSSNLGGYDRQSSASQTSRSITQTTEIDDPLLQNAQITQNQLKQLVVNETAGIILVTDFTENQDKIASFLADVEEGSKRQVLIQAHIMEVSLKDSFSLGIDWKSVIDKASNMTLTQALIPVTGGASALASTGTFKFSASGSDFSVLIDAMKEQGNVNMLSSPKISALNNQKAVIKLTTKEVSWISTKTTQNNAIGGQDTFTTTPQVDEVGIFLDVTPQIGQEGSITMQIHPSVSEIREVSTSPDKTSTKPVINVREIDTMVDARAGETIVIAGLISDRLTETKNSVPLLGDIPYLGMLFSFNKQERSKSELVIMMTPYILNARNVDEIRAEHEKRMRDMGGDFHLINNLGSLVTEKSSRDWIMRTNRTFPAGFQSLEQPENDNAAPATTKP
jgi:MSHA biogenesis protein MshL